MFDARREIIDPLFQLNLLIWQTLPKMPGSRHILNESGYGVHGISTKLSVPLEIQEKMNDTDIDYKKNTSPDLIVKKEGKFAIIEMKKNSFGIESTNSRQANSLLLMNNGVLMQSLGYPADKEIGTHLSYMTIEKKTDAQRKTLKELERSLVDKGIDCVDHSVFGIDCDDDNNVYLCLDEFTRNGLEMNDKGRIKVLESDGNTDPTPLYIIPHDPNSDHDGARSKYTEQVFREKVHSQIISTIGLALIKKETEINIDNIIEKLTFGLFKSWGDTGAVRNLKKNINGYLNDISLKTNKKIFKKDGKWFFRIDSFDERNELIGMLKKLTLEIKDFEIPTLFEYGNEAGMKGEDEK